MTRNREVRGMKLHTAAIGVLIRANVSGSMGATERGSYSPSRLAALFAALSLLAGCAGGGGGTGGGSTDAVTALTRAGQQWDSIPHTDLGAATTQMVNWLKTQPAFADEGVSKDLTVWAVLQDGTGVAFTDDSYLNPPAGSRASLPPGGHSTRAADPGLPAGKTAYLFQADVFTLDPSRTGSDIRPQLVAMLQKAGYNVVRGTGTLADYQAISATDSALLWTNTHGFIGTARVGPAEQTHYYMFSSTAAGQLADAVGGKYYADRKAGLIMLVKEPNQPYYYAFSGAWLVQYGVRFGHNSVWINSACEGATTREMSDTAFHSGLSAYTGWDDAVLWPVANNAAMYLVDRMAGTNLDAPVPSPPQRPFILDGVVADMSGQNPSLTVSSVQVPGFFQYLPPPYNQAHSVTAHLQVAYNPFAPQPPDQYAILTPSIQSLHVDEAQGTLTLSGVFGPDPGSGGQVTVNGTKLSLTGGGWTPNFITCTLPASGAGSTGPVLVTVRGHQSNPRQLTGWQGTFTITRTEGSVVTATATFNVLFRADIADVRSGPHQTPIHGADGLNFAASQSARFAYAISGSVTGTDGCTITYSPNGSPSVPYRLPLQAPLPTSFRFQGVIHQDKSGNLSLFLTLDGGIAQGEIDQSSCKTNKNPLNNVDFFAFLTLNLSGFNIPAGTVNLGTGTSANGLPLKYTASWPGITATAPPVATDPRSVKQR
jgi:hypothetical protein